jgi:hypothetical protein
MEDLSDARRHSGGSDRLPGIMIEVESVGQDEG